MNVVLKTGKKFKQINNKEENIYLTLEINEGERYKFGGYILKTDNNSDLSVLKSLLCLKKGGVFNNAIFNSDIKKQNIC